MPAGARTRPSLWTAAAAVALLLVVGLVVTAASISVRSVRRDGVNCGSVVKPLDVEAFGPAGTNPRPCSSAHDADAGLVLALLATVAGVIVVVVRSRPGRPEKRAPMPIAR